MRGSTCREALATGRTGCAPPDVFGAQRRRSVSSVISRAYCRARSDRPPSAKLCRRHARRRNR